MSLRLDAGSLSTETVASDDLEARSIEVRGNRLLLKEELLVISALVRRVICGPSLLRGRYTIESLPLEGTPILLGVTLPSMKADCDTRLICVGVIGIDALC